MCYYCIVPVPTVLASVLSLQIFPSFPNLQTPSDFPLIPQPPDSISFSPHIHKQYQMWQSQVEIDHHFVACFDRITACVPRAATQYFHYRLGSYVLCKLINTSYV